jgi:hypothetical protein
MRVCPPTSTTSDIGCLQASVLQRSIARFDRALDQVVDQRFQLRARQLDVEVLRPVLICGNERQIDVGLGGAGKFDLGLFGGILESLQRQPVLAQIDALFLAEFVGQIIHDPLVEILTAEEGVAVGRLDLEHTVADLENRDVEGAAAEIVDRDLAAALLVQPVGEGGRGRLVDDAQHFKPGDAAGILGRLALRVVEIGRHGDHGLRHLAAEIGFRGLLHLGEDEGADLARAVFLALDLDPGVTIVAAHDVVRHHRLVFFGDRVVVAPTDQPLDGVDRIFRIGDALALGRLPDQHFAIVGEGDHRRRGAGALGIFNDPGLASFHHGNARVGGSEIDANCFRHDQAPWLGARFALSMYVSRSRL